VNRRAVGLMAASVLVALGLLSAFIGVHLNPSSGGTLLVQLSSRSGDSIGDTQIELHSHTGGWSSLAHLSNTAVPPAPRTVRAAEADVAPGRYDGIRLAAADLKVAITVRAGQVEPVLIAVAGGVPQAAYAGTEDFNDGLLGLQGKLKSLPDFALVDQDGQTVTRQSVAGSVVVLAAFHTTCHDTCPLYTAILHQLRGKVPPSVRLLEVSTDPPVDDVAALKAYAQLADTSWPLLTGSQEQLLAFWSTFGVQLSGADSHTNFLGVFDAHGFLHQVETGVPDAGTVPGGLAGILSPIGVSELKSHGDGWDAALVADQARSAAALGDPSAGGGGQAPAFSASGLSGGKVALADFAGGPVVLNFWASSCAPCRQEMPLIAREAAAHHVKVLLVDERDSAAAARSFLAEIGVGGPVAADPDGAVGRLYGVSVLPVTVFIRADGSIEGKYLGETDAALLDGHLSAIGS
jgi:cytochrome oxidase Cu insertion factor (SCO1/SenC/PrrC family)/thiol-disulfide isomerase/thioredoxin